jgi:hypothetical protein
MAGLIYGDCALTALLCAGLLLRAYRKSRYRLLLWSGLCFVGLTLNNLLVVMDKLIVRIDLATPRVVVALLATLILLYGLIWDAE